MGEGTYRACDRGNKTDGEDCGLPYAHVGPCIKRSNVDVSYEWGRVIDARKTDVRTAMEVRALQQAEAERARKASREAFEAWYMREFDLVGAEPHKVMPLWGDGYADERQHDCFRAWQAALATKGE